MERLAHRREVEVRETGDGQNLHGVLLQEGRAGRQRSELFTPGSVRWSAGGIGILPRHHAAPVARAIPTREADGRITIRTRANAAIREAVASGRKYMSVEFYSLKESRTGAGIREIESALVADAALVASPEYAQSSAEIRQIGTVTGALPLNRQVDCTCAFEGRRARRKAIVQNIDLTREALAYYTNVRNPIGPVKATRRRGEVSLEVPIPDGLSFGRDILALAAAGAALSIRPFPNLEESTMETEGDLDTYELLVPSAWVVLASNLAGDLPEAEVDRRRRRLRLLGAI